MRRWIVGVLTAAILLVGSTAGAVTFRMANQGDPLSMDPHSLADGLQLNFLNNVYEALVTLDQHLALAPALATDWKQVAPTTWRFHLRRGVTFHDGTPFTADDVIFSWQRARAESSEVKVFVGEIVDIRRLDDWTIDIVSRTPDAILPNGLFQWFVMSRRWCVAQKAEKPVDKRKGIENTASFKANGTGPFVLRSREPGVRTVLAKNPRYWEKVDGNIDEVIFTPIANPSTRVAALISGAVDMMEPVPQQDIARIDAGADTQVLQAPELRTIFLGMDQRHDELTGTGVTGRNPFRDRRVRQAFYQAIDIETIRTKVMRGASTPTAQLVAPSVHGYVPALAKRLPYDVAAARKLMADAGYASGFTLTMNCPNDRYVADAEICQAIAAMLARIDVRIKLVAEPKANYFPRLLARQTSFYLMGWTPAAIDAHNVLDALVGTPDDASGRGQWNVGGYSNPKVDVLLAQIRSETDPSKRDAELAEATRMHQDDIGHIPLHQQALAWGVRKNVSMVQLATNDNMLKWVVMR